MTDVQQYAADPGAAFHEHLMPAAGQLDHPGRRERDPVLVDLQLTRDTDPHPAFLLSAPLGAQDDDNRTLRPDWTADSGGRITQK